MRHLSLEARALCRIARRDEPPGADLPAELDAGCLDWDELWTLAHRHEVVPLAWSWLRSRPRRREIVPPRIAERMERRYFATAIRNRRRAEELGRVLRTFRAAGVAAMPVKGLAIAETVYGDVALRTFDDIDLLVRPADLDGARGALRELGYRTRAAPIFEELHHRFHDLQYFGSLDGGVQCVELHWDLWSDGSFASDVDGLWARARTARIAGVEAHAPSDEDVILHLAIHRVSSPLRLRFVCDVAELVRARGDGIDWTALERRATTVGARTALHMMLRLAADLLDAPIPDAVLARTRPGPARLWLLDRTCGARALFRRVDTDDVKQQPRLAYRVLEQDRPARMARSILRSGARKVAKARFRRTRRRMRRSPAEPASLDERPGAT